jgi:hypothetical protein
VEGEPEYDTLILISPPHMEIGIIGELEDVGWQILLMFRGITIFRSIFLEDRI